MPKPKGNGKTLANSMTGTGIRAARLTNYTHTYPWMQPMCHWLTGVVKHRYGGLN